MRYLIAPFFPSAHSLVALVIFLQKVVQEVAQGDNSLAIPLVVHADDPVGSGLCETLKEGVEGFPLAARVDLFDLAELLVLSCFVKMLPTGSFNECSAVSFPKCVT